MSHEDVIAAHDKCHDNMEELAESTEVGCFGCLRIYDPSEVEEYTGNNDAICPYCRIDSVIGDASGYPITDEFLKQMHRQWFGRGTIWKNGVKVGEWEESEGGKERERYYHQDLDKEV